MSRNLAVAIVGPTCSGKSTLCQLLETRLSGLLTLSADDYYLDDRSFPYSGQWRNWELPECIDYPRLFENLEQLKQGRATTGPQLDHTRHSRELILLQPKPIIIAQGLHLLNFAECRDLFELKIYLDIRTQTIRKRRIGRDPQLLSYIDAVVLPSCEKYVSSARLLPGVHIVNAERPLQTLLHEVFGLILAGIADAKKDLV